MRRLGLALALLASPALAQQPRPPTENPANAQPVWLAPNPNGQTLTHLSAAGSTLIKTGSGWISSIAVNTAATSGSLRVYDGVDATGAVIGVLDVSKNGAGITGSTPWAYHVGLYVVLSGTADVTIVSH
jgi:hypothetical protein